jgi:hypothetical protein
MTPGGLDNSGSVSAGSLAATRAVVARAGRAIGTQRAISLASRGALAGAAFAAAGVTLARGLAWEPNLLGLGVAGTLGALAGMAVALPAMMGAAWVWVRWLG